MSQNQATPLHPGETRSVTIEAATYWNRTGILLQQGVSYELRAAGTWRDAKEKCGPDGHDLKRLRWFRWLRRSRPHNWFALMGKAGDQTFHIGLGTPITPNAGGELLCFANDVPFMYWNNHCSITLSVTRTA